MFNETLTKDSIVIKNLSDPHIHILHFQNNVKVIHVKVRFSIPFFRRNGAFDQSSDIVEPRVERSIATGW